MDQNDTHLLNRQREGDSPIMCGEVSSTFERNILELKPFLNDYERINPIQVNHVNRDLRNITIQSHPLNHPKFSHKEENGLSTTKATIAVVFIFITSLIAVFLIYLNFPPLEEEERAKIKLPWDIEDAKQLGFVLERYKDKYFLEVISGICVVYIFLQTFAIPGSLFLSILSGFLFPFVTAISLICICSAVGASLCYMLSQLLGRRLVKHYFPEKAKEWAKKVQRNKDDLFNYMLFLRITPLLPNWFINLVAPVVGVPLFPFAFGTLFGVMPPSILAIQAGKTLNSLTSTSSLTWDSILILGGLAVGSLVPVLLRQKLKKKFE